MSERSVAVYHDEGTGPFSRGSLIHALSLYFQGRATLRRIFAAELCRSDDWQRATQLLVIPGGAAGPYGAALGGAGNASIVRFVEAGGALLGVCAGAYYASARIVFEAGFAGEIKTDSELALFQGTARGALHELAGPYSTEHLRCCALVSLHAPRLGREVHALYRGGPEFIADAGARFEPLLRYRLPDGRQATAALQLDRGLGRVVLCGVHAEITGEQLACEVSLYGADSFEHGMRVAIALSHAEQERRALFEMLLQAAMERQSR